MFVIQDRINNSGKWRALDIRYETLEEAQKAMAKMPKCCINKRIAEEYTVIRYKAVK